ncbi:unnamed protein product [Camellia sinensis]
MEWLIGCWILTAIILGLSLLYKPKMKKEGQPNKSEIPRGSSGWPFIGETLDFIASGYTSRPVSFMDKRKSLYGKVFKTHILGRPIIVSTDPEVNKVVLQNQGNIFIPYYPKSITELLGKSSILQMNGTLQRRVHGLIGGFFRSPQLKARITRDIQSSVRFTLSTWKDKQPLLLQQETKKITFEVLVRVLMSVGPGDDLNFLEREYEEFIRGLICLPVKFPGTTLYKSLKAKERLLNMVRRIVEDRTMALEKTDDKGMPNDAVDVLLRDTGESNEVNQRLPMDFIAGNIIEMMIPGEDSVPMVMTLAVKFLSDSPVALSRLVSVQFHENPRVREYLTDTFYKTSNIFVCCISPYKKCPGEENMDLKRSKAHSCDDYAWTDYMSLPFTQNVISETLRMGNIINAVWRKALNDVEIKGYLIPKGWCVLASFSSVHMDEENYENPYQFDPWRWEKTGAAVAVNCSNTFTPFGGGQRLCPGLELSRWVAWKDEIVNFPTVKMKQKLPITIFPIDIDH